ncbi:hypothetical protein TNCV_4487821 [Trichonephila clavipes]|nr:hypothetical protein TNCV_4487821 [Trichonephila clavipes]
MRTRGVRESYPIPPDTIIPGAEPVWRCIAQLFSILSPRCLKTRIRPLFCCRQMRDSAVKKTSFHSAAQSLLLSQLLAAETFVVLRQGIPSNGRFVDRSLCCKLCRMVRADTE